MAISPLSGVFNIIDYMFVANNKALVLLILLLAL